MRPCSSTRTFRRKRGGEETFPLEHTCCIQELVEETCTDRKIHILSCGLCTERATLHLYTKHNPLPPTCRHTKNNCLREASHALLDQPPRGSGTFTIAQAEQHLGKPPKPTAWANVLIPPYVTSHAACQIRPRSTNEVPSDPTWERRVSQ